MSICSLDPPDLSRNSTADVALEHWADVGPEVVIFLAVLAPWRCRMLASPMSTRVALCVIGSHLSCARLTLS